MIKGLDVWIVAFTLIDLVQSFRKLLVDNQKDEEDQKETYAHNRNAEQKRKPQKQKGANQYDAQVYLEHSFEPVDQMH